MSVLAVDYSQLKSASSYSRKVATNLENYSSTINKKVATKISELGYSSGNISQASWFTNKKIKSLNEKADRYNKFADKLDDFREKVKETDKTVSNLFKSLSKTFTQNTEFKSKPIREFFTSLGIGIFNSTSLGKWVKNAYNTISDFATNISDEIKHWYNYSWGKYACDIVISVLAITAGIVAIATATAGFFAVCAIIAGVFMILNGIMDIYYSTKAIVNNSDPAKAAKYGKIDKVSDFIRSKTDNKIAHIFAGALDFTEAFVTIANLGKSISGLMKKSNNFTAFKKLFSKEKGLGGKFLTYNAEARKDIYKFGNISKGIKAMYKEKGFTTNLIKNFKSDLAIDGKNAWGKVKGIKDVFTSAWKNKQKLAYVKNSIKAMYSNSKQYVNDFFKAKDSNKDFNGRIKIVDKEFQFSRNWTEAIRKLDYTNGIYKKYKDGISPFAVLGNNDVKEICDLFTYKGKLDKQINKIIPQISEALKWSSSRVQPSY